jgi:hypothetical protein
MLLDAPAAGAQPRPADLDRALTDLAFALEALPSFNRPPRLRAAVEWLRRRGATSPEQVTEAYVRSLQQAAAIIRRNPPPPILEDVVAELEAKVEHCRSLNIGMGGTVALDVNTRRGSAVVNDWQVFYLLKIYEHIDDASSVSFPNLSAPAHATLEPGRYWLWARDPVTGRVSDRTLVRVVGRPQLTVDLPVP